MKLGKLIIFIMLILLGACRESNIDPNTNPAFDRTPTTIVNHPPTLDHLFDQIVPEGSPITTIDLGDGGDDFDFDNEPITYTCFFDTSDNDVLDSTSANCSTLPGLVSFNPLTGILNWTPDYSASGIYEVWFTATDGSLYDLKNVLLTISPTNRAPNIDSLPLSIAGAEGSSILAINLADGGDDLDSDGDIITYTCLYDSSLNAVFNGPGTACSALPGTAFFDGASGLLTWTPAYGAAGSYEVWFTATDGSLSDTKYVQFTISATNRSPSLDALPATINGAEGSATATLNLADGGDDFDIDGDALTYSCDICSTLPGTKSFNSATGVFDWTPDYTASGTYTITFTASDGSLTNSRAIQFSIANTNQPPKINTLTASVTVSEGSAITAIDLTDGSDDFDADGEAITYSCLYDTNLNNSFDGPGSNCSTLPGSVSFNAATGVFNWTPDYSASGSYEVWFTATDGALSDSKHIQFTVLNTNRSPVLDNVVASIFGAEGSALPSIDLSDGGNDLDIDGDLITYNCVYETTINGTFDGPGTSCSSLPGTKSFNTATGVFDWTPDYSASGTYEVWFKATDSYGATSAASLIVYTITNVDPLPAFAITGVTGGSDVTLDARLDFILNPTITWQASAGADNYEIVVFENDGSTVACPLVTGLTSTSHNFSSCVLTRGTYYKARVTAKSASGASQTSSNDLYSFKVNGNPVAVNDGPYYIVAGGNITVNVLADNLATPANDPDTDPENDPISLISKTNGTKGNTSITGSSIIYTGTAGQTGMDTFTYTISDNKGGSATGTVTIYIISGFTWTGAVNSSWSNTGNWCGSINPTKTSCSGGASLPTTTSSVQFNSACINCNVNIDVPIDILDLTVDADFSGVISQNTNTINVRNSWTHNGGTFNGGSAAITAIKQFTLNGGTFKSTTETFRYQRNQGCCGFATDTFVIGASATFNHNNGTIYFYGESSNGTGSNVNSLQINTPNVIYHNITFDGADTNASGGFNNTMISLKAGTTITVLNLLKQVDGKLITGAINLLGNAEFTCSSVNVCAENGGEASYLSTDIQFNASMPIVQTLKSVGGGRAPSITISGSATVNVDSDTNDLWVFGNFKQLSGVFNAPPGWLKIHSASVGCCSGNVEGFRILGGVFNDNGSSLYLSGHNGNSSGTPTVGTFQVPLGFAVNSFHYDSAYHSSGTKWDFGTNIINVEGNFIHSDGYMAGTPHFIVNGSVSFTCTSAAVCSENSPAKITFEGNTTQFITVAPSAGISTGTWIINKPVSAGSFVSLASPLILNGVSQDLTIESGVLAMNGYNLIVRDALGGNNNVLTLGPNTMIDRGATPGTIDAEVLTMDPSAVITP